MKILFKTDESEDYKEVIVTQDYSFEVKQNLFTCIHVNGDFVVLIDKTNFLISFYTTEYKFIVGNEYEIKL